MRSKRFRSPIDWRFASSASSKLSQILGRSVQRRVAGEPDLEEDAGVLEIADAIGSGKHVPGRAGERIDDEPGRRARHPGALARAHLDKPHLAQMQQRFAHRWPADAEVTHEVALGRQPVGFRKIPVAYHLLEMMCDLVGQFTRLYLPTTHLAYLLYQQRYVACLDLCQSERPLKFTGLLRSPEGDER